MPTEFIERGGLGNPDDGGSKESIKLRPIHYLRSEAPTEMLVAAEKYERKFGIRFDSLTYFSKELFDTLHRKEGDVTKVPDSVTIASQSDETILDDMEALGQVANSESVSLHQRERYFSALKSIYGKLPSRPDLAAQDESTLFVGIEREGRILAEAMGWLPATHNLHPDAKRVAYDEGLLIGLGEFPPLRTYSRCFIIDGAIASGATIITVIEKLRALTPSFHIYSVHSPYEGLHAITRYGRSEGIDVSISVGHATTGINAKFYAVDPSDPARVVVGDLGDTINDLQS
ncbi:MAG TPA: hypothetical protein VF538_16970 [Pyrinomonadaceae bacterium]|jgi:hypothetical protein